MTKPQQKEKRPITANSVIQTAPVGHTPRGPYAAWSLTSPMVARERDDEVSVCVCGA